MKEESGTVVLNLDYEFGLMPFIACDRASLRVTKESIRENSETLLEVLAPEVEARALQIIADREEDAAQRQNHERDNL